MFPRSTAAQAPAHFTARAPNKNWRFAALMGVLVSINIAVNALIILLDGSKF